MTLSKDSDENVRGEAAWALSQQSALPPEALQCLMTLSKDPDEDVRRKAAEALQQQPVWKHYHFLANGKPSFFKELYNPWLIEQNFKHIVPLYIENEVLSFYNANVMEFEPVHLKEGNVFRKAIREAQEAVGIPLASRVKYLPNTLSVQDGLIRTGGTSSPSRIPRFQFHKPQIPQDDSNRGQARPSNTR